jgi:phosphatidylinositol alpha 1,6-mannosyltransferase
MQERCSPWTPTVAVVRVAIVAESFLPHVNGVSTTVVRLANHLARRGHATLIVAPGPGDDHADETQVVRMKSFGMPFYRECRVARVDDRLDAELEQFRPDVIHLAAPFVLGRRAGRIATRMGVPVVAVYQTDLAGFSRRYHFGVAEETVWSMVRAAHRDAAITLAPSTVSAWQLRERGIEPVTVWPRGVDQRRFSPTLRDEGVRRLLAPNGGVIVGYVGRLAREKQVERLLPLTELPGVTVVIVGDGPRRRALERQLVGARFVGFRRGDELSRLVASLDIFVHPGLDETFCQSIQEALAAGVPVVAPAAGGPLDLVRHGVNGFLWSPEAPETLCGAVRELVADPALRRQLGAAARSSVAGRSWPAVLDHAIAHYRTLVEPAVLRASA